MPPFPPRRAGWWMIRRAKRADSDRRPGLGRLLLRFSACPAADRTCSLTTADRQTAGAARCDTAPPPAPRPIRAAPAFSFSAPWPGPAQCRPAPGAHPARRQRAAGAFPLPRRPAPCPRPGPVPPPARLTPPRPLPPRRGGPRRLHLTVPPSRSPRLPLGDGRGEPPDQFREAALLQTGLASLHRRIFRGGLSKGRAGVFFPARPLRPPRPRRPSARLPWKARPGKVLPQPVTRQGAPNGRFT